MNMKRLFPLWALSTLCVMFSLRAVAQVVDLSGTWQFAVDRNDVGETQKWYAHDLDDTMLLPGSMPEMLKGDDISVNTEWTGSLYDSSFFYNPAYEKYRQEGNMKLTFFLTPDKHYVGAAWYRRTFTLPKDMRAGEMRFTIMLERPHWETTLWINGKKVGMQNSLTTPHVFDVTGLVKRGKNTIAVRVDNRVKEINPGPDSHSITDQTQGNWNGIVGKIELRAAEKIWIDNVQVFPNVKDLTAVVRTTVINNMGKSVKGTLDYVARCDGDNGDSQIVDEQRVHTFPKGTSTYVDTMLIGERAFLWDEYHPNVYYLRTELRESYLGTLLTADKNITTFGMREFTIGDGDGYFYVNGRQIMLRGTVENCDFPLTGYAPMDQASWEKVFRICKRYGLNHMRFHSFCPPEAAFAAADKVGFYLQPEGPSWPNHGSSLGNGEPIDDYLWAEAERMIKTYGNHPSFCMMAIGNEPRGNWVEWVSKFVDYWKEKDPRRVYTGASVGGGWQWQPKSQYHVKAGARGLDWDKRQPATMDDFRDNRFILQAEGTPYVSHETGQWCVFPNFDEIRKYTGVNKARNFEVFRDILEENDMGQLGHSFTMASGHLQALCYKYEIEKTLRTPGYAGFQLLALNDYSGQGSALVGVTDVFFGEKEYIDAKTWRRFCCETVPLARLPRFVYEAGDTLRASIEISHFGEAPLEKATILAYLCSDEEADILVGIFHKDVIPIGAGCKIGEVVLPIEEVNAPRKKRLEVRIYGTDYANDWDVWFYPNRQDVAEGDVYVTDSLDSRALDVLAKGGDVLITAAGKVTYGQDVKQQFLPVFWNTSWFKMRPPHTTGIFVNDAHPLFREFPTDYYSNLQWWELLNHAQVMQFTNFPKGFQPLVQSIDTWFISRKIGVLFEAKVLKGRLLMTTLDIDHDLEKRIVARQLRTAIFDYMSSPRFRPEYEVPVEAVSELFTRVSEPVNMFTKSSPDELKPKIGK